VKFCAECPMCGRVVCARSRLALRAAAAVHGARCRVRLERSLNALKRDHELARQGELFPTEEP
jgi:hypothetical protein